MPEEPLYYAITNLLVLCLFGALVTLSGRIVGEEPNAATQANISQRDQLGKQASEAIKAEKFDEATRLFEQVYTLEESIFGPANEKLLKILGVLAQLVALQQDQQAVIGIRQRQHRITEQLYGKSDYRTQDAQRAVVEAEQNATRTDEQRASLREASQMISTVSKLNGERQFTQAIPLVTRATAIRKQILGEQHPNYATSLVWSAFLYESTGDYPRAEPLYAEAMEISLRSLEQTASVQTESQKIAMSQSLRHQLDSSIRCGLAMDPQPQAFMRQVMAWKGSVFVRLRGLRLAAADPAIADTLGSLQSVTQRLSSLSGAIPAPEKRDAWQVQVAELNRQKDILDAQLMRDSVAFRSAQQQVTLDDVREAIPSGGAIVNYLEYAGGKEGRSLVAMVVRRDSDPVMVRLGSAADAGNAIRQWRDTLGADDAARQAGVRLRKQLWEPLLSHLGDTSLIFVSTDGVLGQLPFVALPGKADGSFLIEDHALVMLPVPRLLPQLMKREQGRRLKPGHQLAVPRASGPELRTAVLMGDVDYDSAALITPTPEPTKSNPSAPLLLASNPLRGVRDGETYPALAATGKEIDAIADLFRASDTVADPPLKIIPLRGRGATETEFRKLAENTRWMHLATHGFFAGADKKNALAAVESDREKPGLAMESESNDHPKPLVGFSPGRLSGLVFAGANRWSASEEALPSETLDDGIMTADEIMYLQLENVELAVLSACETGLGETAGGEGILGLQRAFQIAGARTTVASLWKVDDAATQVLMVEFYRNLFERKLSKLESLRQAQLWMLNNPEAIEARDLTTRGQVRETKTITAETKTADDTKRSLPAYWAAFQLSGDPR